MLMGNFEAITKTSDVGKGTLQSLGMLAELCETIPSLNPVLDQIEHAADKIGLGVGPLILHNELEVLQRRIMSELKGTTITRFRRLTRRSYRSAAPFGENVYNNFPSARLDIQNAGKCIILGQGTAGGST